MLILAAATMLFASCAVHRAEVLTTTVQPDVETTKTKTTLVVAQKRISFTYVPTKTDAKTLSMDQLVQNATYMALQANGNADVLVKVNHYVSMQRSVFGKRVKSIMISGYPAHYRDFREVE